MRLRVTLACLFASALAGAGAAPAGAIERIDAAFLSEYSAEAYAIDQGEIVTFGNRDKFLSHGLVSDSGGLFGASVITWGQVRLLRGAPFLTTGSYSFHCPIHQGMTAVLNVTAAGAPKPMDGTGVHPAGPVIDGVTIEPEIRADAPHGRPRDGDGVVPVGAVDGNAVVGCFRI